MRKRYHILSIIFSSIMVLTACCGCGNESASSVSNHINSPITGTTTTDSVSHILGDEPSPSSDTEKGTRDNTPCCLVPVADGLSETHNDIASIDYSHASDGYI